MTIQRAGISDIPAINRLLRQVLTVHHEGRPDLFKPDGKKYTDEELCQLLVDESRPVFGAWLDGMFVGYAFCILQEHKNDNVLTDIRTLYIDDLCVEETMRGQHVGTALYEYVLDYARSIGCYNVTLKVWTCNPSAMRFYERLGMQPQKIGMETVLM